MEVEPGSPTQVRLERMQANLREAMVDRSVAQVARGAGISHRDVRELLHGGHADMFTVAKLEAYLDKALWPRRHRRVGRTPQPAAPAVLDEPADA